MACPRPSTRASALSLGGVADEPLGCEVEPFFDPINHRRGGLNLRCTVGTRGLHVQDHAVLGIDQVVRRVGIEGWATSRRRPARLGSISECSSAVLERATRRPVLPDTHAQLGY